MPRQPTLVGNPVLIVVDIQKGAFMEEDFGIPVMPGHRENIERSKSVVAAAHDAGIPVIFIQEIHRRDMVDFGRELDGTETVHCLDGDAGTPVAFEEMGRKPSDYFIHKRRYSAFYGTELEILLKGLKAQTLILIGGLTDVCVHYTFADGHQGDYYCRVVGNCVGGSSTAAHHASLNAMEYLQQGAVVTADQINAELRSLQAAAA
jgi:nicotinamidase-related amidase